MTQIASHSGETPLEICRDNAEGNIRKQLPRIILSDQFQSAFKKAGVRSENKMRACTKILMNVNEAREVSQDLIKRRSIVIAYLNGNPRA